MGIFAPFGYRRNRIITVAPAPITTGLQLYLDAGNPASYPGSGTTWTDLSGNNYNATLINSPSYLTSNGGELDFNGTNQYATIYGLPGTFLRDNSWTMQFWVKWDVAGSDQCIASQGISSANKGFLIISRNTSGSPRYVFAFWFNDMTSSTIVTTTSYTFLTLIYNQSTRVKQTYVNDVLDTPLSATQNQYTGTTQNFELARRGLNASPDGWFDGKLGQVLLYNRILTTSEITQNYNTFRNRFGL